MIYKLALVLAVAGVAQGNMAPKSFVPRHALSMRGGSDAADAAVETGSSLLDPDMVAKAGMALNFLQGAYGAVAPAQALELYGIDKPSGLHVLLMERTCIGLLSIALQAYWLIVKDSGAAAAVGVAAVPWAVHFAKSILSGTPKALGIPEAGDLLNLASSVGVAYAGLTDAGCFDTVLKVLGIWLCANGLFLGFMPEDGAKIWGIKSPGEAETFQTKVLGFWLLAQGVFDVALDKGVDSMKAFGYAWIPVAVLTIMGNFVTKEVDSLKLDSTPQYIWMLIELVVIGTLAF